MWSARWKGAMAKQNHFWQLSSKDLIVKNTTARQSRGQLASTHDYTKPVPILAHPTLKCPEIQHNKFSPNLNPSIQAKPRPPLNTFLRILLSMKERNHLWVWRPTQTRDTLRLLQATCGNSILTFSFLSPPCPQGHSSPWGHSPCAQWLVPGRLWWH